MSDTKPTYREIASSYPLWQEYVDTDGRMTEGEFNATPIENLIQMQEDAFGPEAPAADRPEEWAGDDCSHDGENEDSRLSGEV